MAWRMKSSAIALVVLLLVGSTSCLALDAVERLPTVYTTEDGIDFQVELIAQGLQVPWDMEFTAAGDLIITERAGRLLLFSANGERRVLDHLPQVLTRGESGLMGLALHSESRDQTFIYLCYSEQKGLFGVKNQLIKALLGRFGLLQETELLSWPGDRFHNGCQVAIGPDQKLYVTTGDATEGELAQQQNSLLGKVLRLELDGSVPADNPWPGSYLYATGLRNPQGLAWHPFTGQLYSVDHGPSGFDGERGGDELNRIHPGGNYGWPLVSHGQRRPDLINPQLIWADSVAPAGLVAYSGDQLSGMKNNLFITALAGKALIRVVLDSAGAPLAREELLKGQFGRLRAIAQGPDGHLYLATSNRDGRADPAQADDLLLRLVIAE